MDKEVIIDGKLFVPVEKPIKVEYFRPDEGMKIYHMGRDVLYRIARDAGAFYKVKRATFINKAAFDAELEKYKVTDGLEVDNE